ncbi:serine palmitoyltransferase [Lactarius vividus]|nr:serine palmitoyltransferase [Lactarius vividus]KAH9060250.1 serine palmitoyltransferase [Lactarius vividus]
MTATDDLASALEPLFAFLSYARYVKSSHHNNPGRTVLEILMALFAIRACSEKEADELVDEWTPEPLGAPLTLEEQSDLASVPVVSGANGPRPKLANIGKQVLNLAGYNSTGLACKEATKVRAIETLQKYGVGSCGPPGFYGTIEGLANFAFDSSLVRSQLPEKPRRYAPERGKRTSETSWTSYKTIHGHRGIFEKDGAMVDLPRLLKHKYKYLLILVESISFGTMGRTGRGLTELYNVPATQIDMIIGSVANGLNSSGGFCAGSRIVVDHQHINSTSFVFSAVVPALLAVSASRGDKHPAEHGIDPEHATGEPKPPNPATPAPRDAPSFNIAGEECLLQEIVDEALGQGVWTTRARRLRGQELVEARPSIRLAVTAALSRKECERAAGVIKAAVVKVLTKRK